MSLFSDLNNDGLEESQDRLGGYQPLTSNIYTGKLKAFYAGESKGGAKSITVILDHDGKEYRETVYITNKKGENFFLNKDDKTKKVPMPGFTVADDICLAATGHPLAAQDFEEKVMNIWDPEARKELPKSVQMATDVLGKEVSLGIVKELQNKSELKGNEYVPVADTVERNVINKVFHTESKMTMAEARQGMEAGEFWDKWLERNKDTVVDRRTIKDGQGGGSKTPPQANGNSGGDAPAKKSLFGNKK